MKNKLIYIFLLCSLSAFGQTNNIKKTAGINYTRQAPSYIPSENTGSEIAIDTITGYIWQWHRTIGPSQDGSWLRIGQGIDVTTGGVPPAYTPFRNQSWFAINGSDELYHYSGTGTTWNLVSGGGGATYTAGTGIAISGGNVISNTGDLSTTNELQNLSLSGQSLGISSGTGVTLPIVGVSAGYGTTVSTSSGVATVHVDTTLVPSSYGAASVYRLWPKGNISSYQTNNTRRNWIIYNPNIQASSARNAYTRFDTVSNSSAISGGGGFLINQRSNGIWTAWSSGAGDIVGGFGNDLTNGMGFQLFQNGQATANDWRLAGTRAQIMKAMAFGTGFGDLGITFYKSGTGITGGIQKVNAGDEIGAIRFIAADTTRATSSTNGININAPCSAIVGYAYNVPNNQQAYGGVGIWSTNGSLTQNQLLTVDSTVSALSNLDVTGNVRLKTAGNKITIKTGTNASAGTATLVGGTVTVSTTAVTTNSIIIVKTRTVIVAQGTLATPQADIVNGASFKIKSSNVADASTVDYWIIN